MKSRVIDSIKSAWPRFLRGILGTWCIIGPIILLTGSQSQGIALLLFLVLLPCYGIVFRICLRRDWEALKHLAAETKLALIFIIAGLLIQEITGIFLAIKHDLALAYAFIGFFIAEFVKPTAPMKELHALLRSVIRDHLPFSR